MDIDQITARQLRILLTEVASQHLTVRELRKALFDLDDQDAPIAPTLPEI